MLRRFRRRLDVDGLARLAVVEGLAQRLDVHLRRIVDDEDRRGVEEIVRVYQRSTDLTPLKAMTRA